MLVHKGDKIKNWVGECRDVTPTKLQSQNIFKEHWGGGGRMDVNEELSFCENSKKKIGGGGGGRVGGSG